MQGILTEALPAERERGCQWASAFRSAVDIANCGGAITGNPIFSPESGVTLDGVSDYLSFDLLGRNFTSGGISFVAEITTDTVSDGTFLAQGDGGGTGRSWLTLDGGDLVTYLGGTGKLTSTATIEADTRYTIAVRSDATSLRMWVDGVLVLDEAALTLDEGATGDLYVGCNNLLAPKDVVFHRLVLFPNVTLRTRECESYYHGFQYNLWGYDDRCAYWLPTDIAHHDGSADEALAERGAAATLEGTAGVPTKLTHERGYTLDDADNQFLDTPYDGSGQEELTVSVWVKHDITAAGFAYPIDQSSGSAGYAIRTDQTNDQIACFAWAAAASNRVDSAVGALSAAKGRWTHLVLARNAFTIKLYINGLEVASGASGGGNIEVSADTMRVGAAVQDTNFLAADVAVPRAWNERLSTLQIIDLYQRERRLLGDA